MNTCKFFLICALPLLLILGCEKTTEKSKSSESSQEVAVSDPEPEPERAEGYVILDGLSIALIEEELDKKIVSFHGQTLAIGEKVTVIGEPVNAVYRENEREYSRVLYTTGEEQQGYVRTPYIVTDSTFAVISSDEAVIYSSPKITSPTNILLPRMAFLAIHNDFVDDTFVKVTYADQESSIVSENKFLKASDVSIIEDDVVSAILYYLASKQEGAAKTELLKNAQQFAGSIFLPEINIAFSELAGKLEIEEISASAIVNDDNVNIRDLPSIENGAVIITVNSGDELDIRGRTKEEITINGITDRWYNTTEPEGWIFGAFLDL